MSMKKQSDTMTEEGPAHVLVYGLDQANFEGSFGNQSEWPYPLRYLPEGHRESIPDLCHGSQKG